MFIYNSKLKQADNSRKHLTTR